MDDETHAAEGVPVQRSPYSLRSITFSDGTSVSIPTNSILVLVGANNSGKSRALRDIELCLRTRNQDALAVVKDVEDDRMVDFDRLWQWFETHAHIEKREAGFVAARPRGGEMYKASVQETWVSPASPMQELASFMILLSNTEQRLNLTGSVGAFDPTDGRPTEPLHELYVRADLEERLADATAQAFGERVTVNRAAGGNVHLHLGSVRRIAGPRDVRNGEYIEALRGLKKVHEEGDGIRSYVGVLLSVIANQFPVILLDEPEAFLHPPQAQLLGRELTRLAPEADSQLVVATHSADFLQGVLDHSTVPVTVVRLSRHGDVNHVAILPPETLRDLWGDPLLRYSNLLNGLFHRGVVLCESDSDCRFYQATLDAVLEREGRQAHDLLFTHTGGKERLPVAISAMKAIGVPVQVVADFDVLNSESLMRTIVSSLGGDWAEFEREWRIVTAAVGDLKAAPSVSAVKEQLQSLVERLAGDRLTPDQAKQISSVARTESGWRKLKAAGLAGLPQGQPAEAGQRLLASLESIGLQIVPVGELERWAPTIADHGPPWVSAALEQHVHETVGAHTDFAKRLVSSPGEA